ncbi:3913_t:CDS:1 [Paraglomus brasilianum]|uniref:3913_t:CDS:1 n=1 Tax=Paraglomus brasilianum TaxID=144538 RepID=A0A9N9CH61_9GLOM|nr:3913_t:CDS:1 [Paraglomus brasilianum]
MASAITQIKPATTLYVERCAVTTPVPDIVIMFGWTNGQLKHLSKIASFWRKKGNYHILYYTASHIPYVYLPYKSEKLCEGLLPYLYEWGVFDNDSTESEATSTVTDIINTRRRPKVIAHVFSNGGGGGLAGMIQMLKANNLPFRFSAIILDSVPGNLGFLRFHRLFTATQTNPFKKLITIFITNCIMFLTAPWIALYMAIIRQKSLIRYIVHALLYEKAANCPRLFVYSKKDALVRYADVEKTAKMSADMGYVTDEMVVEDTEHVKHWVDRREIYENTVDRFLEQNGVTLQS